MRTSVTEVCDEDLVECDGLDTDGNMVEASSEVGEEVSQEGSADDAPDLGNGQPEPTRDLPQSENGGADAGPSNDTASAQVADKHSADVDKCIADFMALGLDEKTSHALVCANGIMTPDQLMEKMSDPKFDLTDLADIGKSRADKITKIFAK